MNILRTLSILLGLVAAAAAQRTILPRPVPTPGGHLYVEGMSDGWRVVSILDSRRTRIRHGTSDEYPDFVLLLDVPEGELEIEFERRTDEGTTRHRPEPLLVRQPLSRLFPDNAGESTQRAFGDIELDLCNVPCGEYRIGIPKTRLNDAGWRKNYLRAEQDRRSSFATEDGTLPVRLEARFLISKTEVSVAIWRKHRMTAKLPVSRWQDENAEHPVRGVSFDEARAFCEWLEEYLRSRGYGSFEVRLPSEVEWEVAARGAAPGPFPGTASAVDVAHPRLHPVGSTPADASEFGVLDLGGNVREWTCTRFADDWTDRLLAYADTGEHVILPVVPQRPAIELTDELLVPKADKDVYATVKGGSFRDSQNVSMFDVSWRRSGLRTRGNEMTGFRFVVVLADDV